jgi:hypothetical protein
MDDAVVVAVGSAGLLMVLAFFALGFSHFAAAKGLGRDPGPIETLALGCLLVACCDGLWCLVQPGAPAWWSWLARLAILAGAVAGTAVAHGLDRLAGDRMELTFRRAQRRGAADGQPKPETDCDR